MIKGEEETKSMNDLVGFRCFEHYEEPRHRIEWLRGDLHEASGTTFEPPQVSLASECSTSRTWQHMRGGKGCYLNLLGWGTITGRDGEREVGLITVTSAFALRRIRPPYLQRFYKTGLTPG